MGTINYSIVNVGSYSLSKGTSNFLNQRFASTTQEYGEQYMPKCRVVLMGIYVQTNGITASSTLYIRKNNVDADSMTIPASTTGFITKAISVQFEDNDTMSFYLVTGNPGGPPMSLSLRGGGVRYE